jgi:hypothetical protein
MTSQKPPRKPNAAGLDHDTLQQLIDALRVVAALLDPAGARRRQEQAEQPPQRRKQRRAR